MAAGARKWWWEDLPDRELLAVRLCDLDIRLAHTWLTDCVDRLHGELDARGLRFKPHAWLSSEWFSPDGVPGIAIPFFLAHERLIRLERRKMLDVEGGTERECMKLLRHETGHAICTAFRLHYRARWRETFGPMSAPYPDSYIPRARSRAFVLHLDWWYAQAHPAEDFAETFAVWLAPSSRWRRRYRDWPAIRKLEYVDELMADVAEKPAKKRSRRHIEPLSSLKITLGEYYDQKQERYGRPTSEFYDEDLRRLFSDDPRHESRPSAALFLRSSRTRIREVVARWTGESAYAVDLVLRAMIDRCKELKLRVAQPPTQARYEATVLVAVHTTRILHRVPHRILL